MEFPLIKKKLSKKGFGESGRKICLTLHLKMKITVISSKSFYQDNLVSMPNNRFSSCNKK
jgi:hypothetical protein